MEEKKKKEKKVKPRIVYKNYYLQHSDYAPERFDVHVNGRNSALGYGYTLDAAIRYISLREMSLKTGDRTLKEFISEFRVLVDEVKIAVDAPNLMQD
jgi:hypothetical protein